MSQEVWSSIVIGVTGVVLWRAGRWLRDWGTRHKEQRLRAMASEAIDHEPAPLVEAPASDDATFPRFHIEEEAARFVAENGHRFYIWSEAFGGTFDLLKTSIDEPALEGKTFICHRPDDRLEVYVDETIPPPAEWFLTYHRLPHRHVRADYDRNWAASYGGSGP
jgi:hypothetical protein